MIKRDDPRLAGLPVRRFKVFHGGPPRQNFDKPKPHKPRGGHRAMNDVRRAVCLVRAELVRQARESAGLTFKEIAARMGVSSARVKQLYKVAKFGRWR